MGVIGIIGLILLAGAIYAPQLWVRHTMKKHGAPRADFPGTGGELATHLIASLGLDGVGVETTNKGDHYDPDARMVRLSQDHHDGASLTAVAVATHEVAHALQHHRGERGLALRQILVRFARVTDMSAGIFFLAAPVLMAVARSPTALFAMVAIGIGFLAVRVLVHLVTLPVEYDASFNKALPILRDGGYLPDDDHAGAHAVLKAAAFTYVAAALVSLLDLARWIRLLR